MNTNLFQQYKTFSKGKYGFVGDVALFAIITLVFHYFWWNFLGFFRATGFYETVSSWLATQVYLAALWVNVNILSLDIVPNNLTNTLNFPSIGYITVNESCSGFKQFYQIFFLFLLFPGPWKHKAWFIPASLGVMFLINILRIILLSLFLIIWPTQWDFFHLWVMRPFYYVVIFAEWVIWVEYFTKKRPI